MKKELLFLAKKITNFMYDYDYYNFIDEFKTKKECIEYSYDVLENDYVYALLYIDNMLKEYCFSDDEKQHALELYDSIRQLGGI